MTGGQYVSRSKQASQRYSWAPVFEIGHRAGRTNPADVTLNPNRLKEKPGSSTCEDRLSDHSQESGQSERSSASEGKRQQQPDT